MNYADQRHVLHLFYEESKRKRAKAREEFRHAQAKANSTTGLIHKYWDKRSVRAVRRAVEQDKMVAMLEGHIAAAEAAEAFRDL